MMKVLRVVKTGMCLITALFLFPVAFATAVSAAPCTPQNRTIEDPNFTNGVLDPSVLQKFVTPLPNPLDPSFIYQPVDKIGGEDRYAVSMRQITQSVGLIDTNGCPLSPSKLWVYGDARGGRGAERIAQLSRCEF